MKEELTELDRQITRAVGVLTRKAGEGRLVMAFAADHGMPGEPRPGGRHYMDDISAAIDKRFSPAGGTVVQYLQRRREQPDPPRHGEAPGRRIHIEGRGRLPHVPGLLHRGVHRGRSARGPEPPGAPGAIVDLPRSTLSDAGTCPASSTATETLQRWPAGQDNPDKLAISSQQSVPSKQLSVISNQLISARSAPLHCGTLAPLAPLAFHLKAEATLCGSTRIPSLLFIPA